MKDKKYMSTIEVAKALGISRIAVYKRIQKGQIQAVRIGRNFAIPVEYVKNKLKSVEGTALSREEKNIIGKAVAKAVEDYGDVLKKLGDE